MRGKLKLNTSCVMVVYDTCVPAWVAVEVHLVKTFLCKLCNSDNNSKKSDIFNRIMTQEYSKRQEIYYKINRVI